jgi:hypothetical protein
MEKCKQAKLISIMATNIWGNWKESDSLVKGLSDVQTVLP